MVEQKSIQPDAATRDDLTLRDIIIAFHVYRREAFRFWWVYLLCFLLIGGYLGYKAWSAPPEYQARLTFMVNEEDGNGLGGVSSILGQFGFGRARAGRYNLDKIIELARSRRIIQEVLLSVAPDSDGDYIGNNLIEHYALDDEWAKSDPEMEGFRFTRDSVPLFNKTERAALLALHGMLVGSEDAEGLARASYNENSGILALTCTTTDEALSLDIARNQFVKLSDFYVDQAIERQQKTFEVVRDKVDSIAGELSKADVSLAVFTDASNNLFSRVDQVKGQKLNREILKLSAMQAEAVKNMEYAEFMLKNARPVIQELDIPIAPLYPTKPSWLKALIIAAALAFVVATVYIVARKLIRDAMAG